MSPRSHAFSTDEAPTKPAYRGARRETPTVDDEVPTTLRHSGVVRTTRRAPPPLPTRASRPPPLPRAHSHPPPLPLPRPRIRSLASILEPSEEPCVVIPARLAVLPPDPDAFSAAPEKSKRSSRDSARWLLRIALVMVVLVEELLLAAPAGMLHRPRDVGDVATMLGSAIHSSVVTALGR